jgi:hypothetical protein
MPRPLSAVAATAVRECKIGAGLEAKTWEPDAQSEDDQVVCQDGVALALRVGLPLNTATSKWTPLAVFRVDS